MKLDKYIEMKISILEAFREEQQLDNNKDFDVNEWDKRLDGLDWTEFCITCLGEGYVDVQLDVDVFREHPCPDCKVNWDEYAEEEIEEDYTDEYKAWAGMEDSKYNY